MCTISHSIKFKVDGVGIRCLGLPQAVFLEDSGTQLGGFSANVLEALPPLSDGFVAFSLACLQGIGRQLGLYAL